MNRNSATGGTFLDMTRLSGDDSNDSLSNSDSYLPIIVYAWKVVTKQFMYIEDALSRFLFPQMPDHYTLRKNLLVTRSTADGWAVYDILNILMTIYYCFSYVYKLHMDDYRRYIGFKTMDMMATAFFLLDFMFNLYLMPSLQYFADFFTVTDIVSLIPFFLLFAYRDGTINPEVIVLCECLMCARVIMLIRCLRTFKFMHLTNGLNRQIVNLTMTLIIMIYLATTVVEVLENFSEKCVHINASTNWEPSCSSSGLITGYVSGTPDCDCDTKKCVPQYLFWDTKGEPSGVRCTKLSYFAAFYYIIITVSTIGYGDIRLSTIYARMVSIVFIILSVVLIPMRLSELQTLLQLNNPYANAFVPDQNEIHVIVTGHVSDKRKLEQFLKELFHPDRTEMEGEECHVVILSKSPPTEAVKDLLMRQSLESKITWVLGSPLSISDLKKARADTAVAMFFLINYDLHESFVKGEDAGSVLAALSVSNFNSALQSHVQVLRPENSEILVDGDVDMILCLDEYKTSIQARNSLCPGFTTFVENMFSSFGQINEDGITNKTMPPWFHEYLHGAGMEIYFVPMTQAFIRGMRYNFRRIVELVYVEWKCISLGISNSDKSLVVFNPCRQELREFKTPKQFFKAFSVLIVMADDGLQADHIAAGLQQHNRVTTALNKCLREEIRFTVGLGQRAAAFSDVDGHLKSRGLLRKSARLGGAVVGGLIGVSGKLGAAVAIQDDDSDSDISELSRPPQSNQADKKYHNIKEKRPTEESSTSSGSDGERNNSGHESTESFTEDEEETDDEEDETFVGYVKRDKSKSKLIEGTTIDVAISSPDHRAIKNLRRYSSHNELSVQSNLGYEGNDFEEEYEEEYKDMDEDISYIGNRSMINDYNNHMQHMRTIPLVRVAVGQRSAQISDASILSNHIVVNGCETNYAMFIDQIRRPALSGDSYHTVLIIHDSVPFCWNQIMDKYNDVYLMVGDISKPSVVKRANINKAFSLQLMSARNTVAEVDSVAVNTETLFTFLKLEQLVPSYLHITVELTTPSNMAVLNATIMRRLRDSFNKTLMYRKNLRAQGGGANAGQSSARELVGMQRAQRNTRDLKAASVNGKAGALTADNDTVNAGAILKSRETRRRAAIFDGDGQFATRRIGDKGDKGDKSKNGNFNVNSNKLGSFYTGQSTKSSFSDPTNGSMLFPGMFKGGADVGGDSPEQGQNNTRGNTRPHQRRGSSLGYVASTVASLVDDAKVNIEALSNLVNDKQESIWDAMDSHNVLPVFASAKAFVPSSFENLLVQSFYLKVVPIICEKLVCGQLSQTMMSVQVPSTFIGRKFLDLFRLLLVNMCICVGIFRAPNQERGSMLPYVLSNPDPSTVMAPSDCLLVFGSVANLQKFKLSAKRPVFKD